MNRGDPAALEALIDCYAPYVCGVAARILPGRPEEWEELAGDVFLAAWDNRKKLRPGQVKGWLSTVARNRAFNRRRGHREDLPLEEDILLLQSDLPQSEAEYRELRSTLSLALGSLDQQDRELFVRHYYYGQTVARAAEEMELNLSTAKTRLRRGRERLKRFLQEVGYEPMEN
nr:sigma-70 family RNA polymerase sigma factor [Flintibacter hominis]